MDRALDDEPFLHGTKADLRVGDVLRSNYRPHGRDAEGTRLTPDALGAWRTRLAAPRAAELGEIID